MQSLQEIVKESFSKREVLRKLGMAQNGGTYITLTKKIKKHNIDTSHFNQYTGTSKQKTDIIKFQSYLVKDSKYLGSSHDLKNNLIKKGLIEYKCVICLNDGKWQGKKISLHLDHINGIRNDNRLENLRILCPNCHSQTETFGSKNRIKKPKKFCIDCGTVIWKTSKKCRKCSREISKVKPTKEKLEECIQLYPISEIGKIYNVTGNTVRKWCKGYKINHRPFTRGHWQKVYTEKYGTNGCCKKMGN